MATTKAPSGKSLLEMLFAEQIRTTRGIPQPVREYVFSAYRKWRFDFAWPSQMIAVEIEGGTWVQGRHTRPAAFESDCEKYNEALLEGWGVFRFTSGMVEDGRAITTLVRAFR